LFSVGLLQIQRAPAEGADLTAAGVVYRVQLYPEAPHAVVDVLSSSITAADPVAGHLLIPRRRPSAATCCVPYRRTHAAELT